MPIQLEIDKLLLGVNPFVGIDHFSNERARERSDAMNESRILGVMKAAFESGAEGLTFAGDSIIENTFKLMAESGYEFTHGLYPLIPNTRAYVDVISERGIIGLANSVLSNMSVAGKTKTILGGGLSFLTGNPVRAMKSLLDVEVSNIIAMMPKSGVIRSVFLHEIATDLALALGSREVLETYARHILDSYEFAPGFVTRNFPKFVNFCRDCDLDLSDVVIMTPFNKLGLQMTPSRGECEATLRKSPDLNVVAMSILAAGQLPLEEAHEYISSLKGIKSIAIGVSSEIHARETFTRFSRHWKGTQDPKSFGSHL